MTHTEAMERLSGLREYVTALADSWRDVQSASAAESEADNRADADALALAIRWGALLAEVAAWLGSPGATRHGERYYLPDEMRARVQDAVK